jgi:hypothetical protein
MMTDQELRDFAADHLYYELLMLHETAMGLKWRETLDADFALKNALIESFTVHARVLAQFLYYSPSKKFPDDVTAEHYVRDVREWKAARGPLPADLQEVIDRTGKEIAHLTRGRRPPGDPRKAWTVEHVYRLLCVPLHLFLKHAEPERLEVSVTAFILALPTPPGSPDETAKWSLGDESRRGTDTSTTTFFIE